MSTTFIERTFSNGDTNPDDQFVKIVGGLDIRHNKLRPANVDARGHWKIVPALETSDAFGRIRLSNPVSLFDSKQVYEKDSSFWVESLTGSATATYVTNESLTRLQCTTASGDVAIRQTRRYIPYLPGRSQLIIATGNLGAIKANVTQRIGYFDANNGAFFEQNGTNLRVVLRSSTSGSPVDTAVNQLSWNLDTLDGTGLSQVTIDTTKAQAFVIDLSWLGVGSVRFGIMIEGRILYCHQFRNENSLTTVYMKTPSLPVRYELRNTGTTASSTTLDQICVSATCEGGSDAIGLTTCATTGTTARSMTTNTPIMSLRLKSTYNRAVIKPIAMEIMSTSNRDALVEVYIRGVTSGGSFVSNSPATEVNITATSVNLTNALRLSGTYLSGSTARVAESVISGQLIAAADFSGTTDEIIIVGSDISGGTSTAYASFTYTELW